MGARFCQYVASAAVAGAVVMSSSSASAWERRELEDALSGATYSRLTQPSAGPLSIAGVAAGTPELGIECDRGEGGRRMLRVDVTFPVAISRETFVTIDYRFDDGPVQSITATMLRPWQQLNFLSHSFGFLQQMLKAERLRMEFEFRRRGSSALNFDLSDRDAAGAFARECYADMDMVPPDVAPRVAEYLLEYDRGGVLALQAALKHLEFYSGETDGGRTPALFLALQRYAVDRKADEVAAGDLEHLTRRTLFHILTDDPRIPADIRKQL
ncbi:MAG TPA: hypothetical protein VEU47_07955 [Candidatus Cybelea sp.]|nr:hypothetical protein [Candidatus Cybelea sp.]